jgi:hypothetical protein
VPQKDKVLVYLGSLAFGNLGSCWLKQLLMKALLVMQNPFLQAE